MSGMTKLQEHAKAVLTRHAHLDKRERHRHEWFERSARNVQAFWQAEIAEGALRPASPSEFMDWVLAYLRAGGEPHTLVEGHPRDVLWAARSIVIPDGACGALSHDIIVSPEATVTSAGRDHCTLYIMGNALRGVACKGHVVIPRSILEEIVGSGARDGLKEPPHAT